MKLKHLITTLRHKWYVLVAGRRLRAPLWRLLKHDLSKFSPVEFGAYARQFHGDKGDPAGFTLAWLDHQNRNSHHWEHWVSRDGNIRLRLVATDVGMPLLVPDNGPMPMDYVPIATVPSVTVIPMPMACVREMVADWFAAGKVYAGAWPDPANYTWYKQNRGRMHLHPDTEMRIDLVLAEAATWSWK